MSSTLTHRGQEITIVCAVCSDEFTYHYTTGRIRKVCDSADCQRVNKTAQRAAQRQREKEPPEYPTGNRPSSLSQAEADALVSATAVFTERRRHRRSATPTEVLDSGASPDQVEAAVEAAEGAGDIAEGSFSGTAEQVQALFGSPTVCMDDYRDVDTDPYRLIDADKRPAVRHWFATHDVPRAGLRLDVTRGEYPIMRVLGSAQPYGWDGTAVPRRITRRWASSVPLEALEPFVLSL